jgi:lactoylglutathione lyase
VNVVPEEEPMSSTGGRVTELRPVVTVDDYDEALRFYRDVLGLGEQTTYEAGGARLTVLEGPGPVHLTVYGPASDRRS